MTENEQTTDVVLPPVGTYWTTGALKTNPAHLALEAYATCARCGAFVNSEDRHEEWHRFVERAYLPASSALGGDDE